MIDEFFKLINGCNGKHEKLECDDLENGLVISSINSCDMGYETAIIDSIGQVIPIERYDSLDDLKTGHKKWIEFCMTNPIEVTKLGYETFVEPEIVKINYPKGKK